MKVTTDACLFGAWAADKIESEKLKIENVLDIGSGTGLLSLMLAQKISAHIDAVEIDELAAIEAASNFQQSAWKKNLHLHHTSIQKFQSNRKYDFIISNPPFFENDLKSNDIKKNIALHNTTLSLNELLYYIKLNLNSNGKFAVLLPYHRSDYFIKLCILENFYVAEKVLVKQTPQHSFFRAMILFSRNQSITKESEITFKKLTEGYTNEFTELLQPYYLYL